MSLMKKLSWLPSLLVMAGLMLVASCKEDEKPKSQISFSIPESEANETDGTIEIQVNLSSPLSEKAVIGYSLSGTATEDDDFTIDPDGGYITIGPGASSFTISVELYEDYDFEVDFAEEISYETITITLDEVVSGPAVLKGELTHTLTVYEDDLLVLLTWENTSGTSDLDMFCWIDDPDTEEIDYGLINPDYVAGTLTDDEYDFLILLGGFPDGNYAFSYTYREGTSNEVTFLSEIINFGGPINDGDSYRDFTGTYTLANVNPWNTVDGTDPVIRQTGTKAGLEYTDLTGIDLDAAGTSRMSRYTGHLPEGVSLKTSGISLEKLRAIAAKRRK